MSQVRYREATQADRHCVEEHWIASFRTSHYAGPFAPLDRSRWHDLALPEIRRILDGPDVEVIVAYNPDFDADTKADIYGWLALQRPTRPAPAQGPMVTLSVVPPVVLYVYVKDAYRGWSIARGLFRQAGVDPWRDRYQYICRTEALMEQPGIHSRWTRPMIERMGKAEWNPRVTRWRRRAHEREEEQVADDTVRPDAGRGDGS